MGNVRNILKDLEELDSENQVSETSIRNRKSKQKKEFTDLLLSISGDLLEKKTRYTEHTSNTRLDISAVEEENETIKGLVDQSLNNSSSSYRKKVRIYIYRSGSSKSSSVTSR